MEVALRLSSQLPFVAHRHYAEISFMWSNRAGSEGNDRFLLDIKMTVAGRYGEERQASTSARSATRDRVLA